MALKWTELRVVLSQHTGVATHHRHHKIAGFFLGNACESGFVVISNDNGNIKPCRYNRLAWMATSHLNNFAAECKFYDNHLFELKISDMPGLYSSRDRLVACLSLNIINNFGFHRTDKFPISFHICGPKLKPLWPPCRKLWLDEFEVLWALELSLMTSAVWQKKWEH